MIIRDSSSHQRGSKGPQGISQGWLQQALSQVKQPTVVAKQVEKCVDILVRSIFLLGFFFVRFFCVPRSWKSMWFPSEGDTPLQSTQGPRSTEGDFCSVEVLRMGLIESEQPGKAMPYKLGKENFRPVFALRWTWGKNPLDHSRILVQTGYGAGHNPG